MSAWCTQVHRVRWRGWFLRIWRRYLGVVYASPHTVSDHLARDRYAHTLQRLAMLHLVIDDAGDVRHKHQSEES